MRLLFRRAIVAAILAPYVALLATAAPEHAHEADADHPHSTVHRHPQPHAVGSHDEDHAELADDDDHVVWVDSVALHEPGYQLSAPALPAAEGFELLLALADWLAQPDYDTAPAHGPPRACLSLRAPPCLSA